MTFAGQLILSSSPSLVATPLRRSISPLSSSPLLPSPSQLFATEITSKINKRKTSGQSNGFAVEDISAKPVRESVSALASLQSVNDAGNISRGEQITESGNKNHAKPLESRAGEEESARGGKKAVAPKIATRKPKKKSAVTTETFENHDQTSPSLQQGTNKKVTKKKREGLQSKIEGTSITKPSAISATVAKKGDSRTENPPHNNTSRPAGSSKKKSSVAITVKESADLLLAEAVRRRKAWTPPKDTPPEASHLEDLGRAPDENLAQETQDRSNPNLGGFENLLDDFGYAEQAESSFLGSDQRRNIPGETLTKKRKIELVNFTPSLAAAHSRKTKLPKRKPQTVTGKATAQFLTVEPETPGLLQYLEIAAPSGNQQTHVEDPKAGPPETEAIQGKSKSKGLKQRSSAKAKKKSNPVVVLHSPKTAMISANEQELVFGTSSQLVREESPTLLRDIQQAIKVSQSMSEESSLLLAENNTPSILSNLPEKAGVTPLATSKNMWSVASRGLDGSLMTVEVIDLIDDTKPVEKQPLIPRGQPNVSSGTNDGHGCVTEAAPSFDLPCGTGEPQDLKTPLQITQNALNVEKAIPRSLAEASLRNRRQSHSPVKKQKIPKNSGVAPQAPMLKEMPNYQGFTGAELCKEIASFGFKAIKKRTEMIALLERCWESQTRIALQTLQPNVEAVQPGTSRIDKDGVRKGKRLKSKEKLSELPTGDDTGNVVPSPPKRRGRPKKSPPALHPPPPPSNLDPLPLSGIAASSLETNLHAQITKAINAAPATHSSIHPNFRERILLYDPIVLEDLTAWLNTEGLSMVGTDEEIGTGVVKEWCEKESVCCISREEGWRARR